MKGVTGYCFHNSPKALSLLELEFQSRYNLGLSLTPRPFSTFSFTMSSASVCLHVSVHTVSSLATPNCWFSSKMSELQSSNMSRCGPTDVYKYTLTSNSKYAPLFYFLFSSSLFSPRPHLLSVPLSCQNSVHTYCLPVHKNTSKVFMTSYLSFYNHLFLCLLSRSGGWWRREADVAGLQYDKGKSITNYKLLVVVSF